jgi:hypothetical protein
MLWSGSSPRSVLRDSMWGFLLFAGVAWLAIAWSVLRLEPADVVTVAAAMIFFGALCEVIRALAGMRTWWLNAGLAALFTGIGTIVILDADSTYTTTASLVGWFLMVRGALDVAVSTMNRGVDRTWGLVMSLGVVQAGLGFFAAGPLFRSADLMVVTLGGLALLRGVADLVTALRLREVSAARHDVLELSPERAEGVAGYAAGREDAEQMTETKARHRVPGATAGGAPAGANSGHEAASTNFEATSDASATAEANATGEDTARPGAKPVYQPGSFHDEVIQTTKDLDAKIADAGVTGTAGPATRVPENLPPVPESPEEMAEKQRK